MAFNKNKVMDAARRFVEKGQTEKAIKEYLRVVKEDPQDVRVWLKIGDLYAKKGDKVEAVETYSKVAKFYSEQGFYLKAVAVYKQILKLEPRLIEVHLKLAELYRQLGLMSDAMRHFEMVAGHFHREGKTREALATVRQLVELDPENVATRIKLAELYSKEGMVEEAVTEFTQACDYLRANARHDDFIKVAERLLWHKPDNMELSRELAGFYLQRNDPRRALQKLQLCFKANARDTETLALLAQAFQALEQKSKTVQVLKELARVFDEDGKREQAADVHRKILALVPKDADSLAYLGQSSSAAVPPPPPLPPDRAVPPATKRLTAASPPELPERRRAQPTGSVPLLDPAQIPGLRYESDTSSQHGDFTSEFTQDTGFEGTAAGEIYAEEIAKLLTETEVYVKYGLHQKAIEHLRRVFELDELNIEARERLKEILLEQGREAEAMAELMRMAEIMAPHDHERTLAYVREALAIDSNYQPAFELAQRYQLPLGGGPEATGAGGGMEAEVDFDDIGFGAAGNLGDEYDFDLGDSDPSLDPAFSGASVTRELGADEVEAMLSMGNAERESDSLDFDARASAGRPGGYDYDLQLIDEPVFDPAAAAAFDAEPGYTPDSYPANTAGSGAYADDDFGGFEGEPAPTVIYGARGMPGMDAFGFNRQASSQYDAHEFDAEPLSDLHGFADDFGQPVTGERPTRDLLGKAVPEPTVQSPLPVRPDSSTSSLAVDTGLDILEEQLIDHAPPSGFADVSGNLEDELDEVDFYIAQGLYDDARETLQNMLARNPDHPLLITKMQDIDSVYGVAEPTKATELPDIGFEELDDLDELALDVLDPVASPPARTNDARPAVMLENPVDDEDADTHFDLGLAYKEMGLYDEAIKAFKKVADSPGREVQCRMMIGLCLREQGSLTDAISQFKVGLHAPEILEAEQLSLYYEIGYTYEMLRDAKEALYFYQIVIKRDPQYRDVPQRMHALSGAVVDTTKPGV